MCESTSRIEQVRYNAAEQCFEALVTLHTDTGAVRVASRYAAPLSAEYEDVTEKLHEDALRKRDADGALKSRISDAPSHRVAPRHWTDWLPFAA